MTRYNALKRSWTCYGNDIFSRKCNKIQKLFITMFKLFFVQGRTQLSFFV